jgi:hypothetical protein
MSFYRFWKNSNFHSKSVGVSLRFYRKSTVWGKNWSKLSISWLWPPYCQSVIHNGPIYEFLQILKKLKFSLKIRSCYPTVLQKIASLRQKLTETHYFLFVAPHIVDRLYIMVPYMSFYGFWKNSNFRSNSIVVSLLFYRNSPVWGKNWPQLIISWSSRPYYGSVIHNCHVYEFLWVSKILKFLLKIRRC